MENANHYNKHVFANIRSIVSEAMMNADIASSQNSQRLRASCLKSAPQHCLHTNTQDPCTALCRTSDRIHILQGLNLII